MLVVTNSSDPNRDTVGKELAGTSGTGTFNVWCASVIFQTRTWTGEILATTISTLASVGKEGVSHPHGVVTFRATWTLVGLTVNGDDAARSFANVASGDVRFHVFSLNSHRWDWLTGGQPVRFRVSGTMSADLIGTAESTWHGTEFLNTRTGSAKTLSMMIVVADSVE